MRYKFREEAVKKYDNKPSVRSGGFKLSWVGKYINFYAATKNLDVDSFMVNDDYGILQLVYKQLQAKTSRYIFRKNLQSIDEVPQRDTNILNIGGDFYLSIVYQLTHEEISLFIEEMNSIRTKIGAQLSEESYRNLNAQEKLVFTKVLNFHSITRPSVPFDAPFGYVKLFNVGTFEEVNILLVEHGVVLDDDEIIDRENLIIYLSRENTAIISNLLGWLVAEVISADAFSVDLNAEIELPSSFDEQPSGDETVVGVIDSGFNPLSPFINFIDSIEDHRQYKTAHDYNHGSATSSLIIDNDFINVSDKDGLGRFKVRHFELLEPQSGKVSVGWAYLYKKIKEIVEDNQDIRIWNLSLGGNRTDSFKVSSHGLLLDKLSVEFDCLFIIAAGNSRRKVANENDSLASPGDSINNITVGSVNNYITEVNRADYSSLGFVLQSIKPDISEFGGPTLQSGSVALVNDGIGNIPNSGTSFSAPKVARLAASFISDGFSIEEIKAKIISLSISEKPTKASSRYGYIGQKDNAFEISQTIPMFAKDLGLIELDIPNEVEEISVTTSYLVNPHPILGHESTIYDVKAVLAEFNLEEKTLNDGTKKVYGLSTELPSTKTENATSAFLPEAIMRFNLGKYSTTKKSKYNWGRIKSRVTRSKVGIKITRLDLHDIPEADPINAAINISFKGEDLTEEIMNGIIQIENTIEVSVPEIESQAR